MGPKWNPERNERFFVLVTKDVKLGTEAYERIAKEWRERYGDVDDFQPTARALQEQYKSLCRRAGANAGGKTTETSPPKLSTTPKCTPKKAIVPKIPSNSAKKRTNAMSDEDDSEDERRMLSERREQNAERIKYERRSKTAKVYEDPGTDAESGIEAEAGGSPVIKSEDPANEHMLDLTGISDEVRPAFTRNSRAMDGMSEIFAFEAAEHELN